MPIRLYNMFPFSGESLVKKLWLVFAQQSKTNESHRVFVLALIVCAPATPFCEFFSFLGSKIDELVYRIECVVDQGRTTQFEEPHTAGGRVQKHQEAALSYEQDDVTWKLCFAGKAAHCCVWTCGVCVVLAAAHTRPPHNQAASCTRRSTANKKKR